MIADAVDEEVNTVYYHIRIGQERTLLRNGLKPSVLFGNDELKSNFRIIQTNSNGKSRGSSALFHDIRTIFYVLNNLTSDKVIPFQEWVLDTVVKVATHQTNRISNQEQLFLDYPDLLPKTPEYRHKIYKDVRNNRLNNDKELYPNKGKRWEDRDNGDIIAMLKEDISIVEIANYFDRTVQSVVERINKYNLRELAIEQKTLFDFGVEA
jgi:hypothetical protein